MSRRRTRAAVLLATSLLAAAGLALLLGERPADAAGLTLVTIRTDDASFADWDAVLANAAQTSKDGDGSSSYLTVENCAVLSTDRDCPQGGGSGNDFLTFAWTYDDQNVYLYIERYGSTSNGVDFFFVADTDKDLLLGSTGGDRVIHARWQPNKPVPVEITTSRYVQLAPDGDPILCVPVAPATTCGSAPAGFVDGYMLPGAAPDTDACAGCTSHGGSDGLRMEIAVPWANFNVPPRQPFHWHVVSSNNGSLASTVDNIGSATGGLGTFVQRQVSLGPDRSGAVLSPGQVTYDHVLANEGNEEDRFGLSADSSQGAAVDLLAGGTLIAQDFSGDGAWDWIAPGGDQDGDGRPDRTLAAGASAAIQVRITMPAGRNGQEVTRLTATSAFEPSVTATATDTSHVGTPAFLPERQEALVQAGATLPFREVLQNGELLSDTFALVPDAGCGGFRLELALDASGAPGAVVATDALGDGSWDTVEPSSDTDADGLPDLGPVPGSGGSRTFWLLVTPPGGTPLGTACTLVLEALSPATGASATVSHGVEVAPAVTFTPDYTRALGTSRHVGVGGIVYFPARIRNAEESARTYALTQSSTPAVAARVWSDPDGDGNPSDGAPITATASLLPHGGSQHVVVEVNAGSQPSGSLVVVTTTATATVGGAAASQVSEAEVGYLASFADALHTEAAREFSPCATVHVEGRGLAASDATRYALHWIPPSGQAPAPVSPWPTTARGTASAQIVLGASAAPGTWTARLLDGGATLQDLSFDVELAGSIVSLSTDRARYAPGDAVQISAAIRNGGSAPLDGTSLRYDVAGVSVRTRSGISLEPGESLSDAFTHLLAPDAAGRYTVTAGWWLSCGAAAFVTRSVQLDVPPPAPAVSSPADGALLAGATPVFAGTGTPGASVMLDVSGTPFGPVTVDAGGAWSYALAPGEAIADRDHAVTATQSVDGIASDPSPPVSFRVDTTPPAAPVLTAPAEGLLTASGSVEVSGTAAGDAVSVEVYGGGALVATVPVAGGSFAATLSLADGAHLLSARALDAAGNRSDPSAPRTVTVDTVAPDAPVVEAPGDGTLLGAADAPGGAVTISGTAEAGAAIEVTVDGSTRVADRSGTSWSAVFLLADGPHAASATARDAAGNVSGASASRFDLDTAAPLSPAVETPAPGSLLGASAAPGGAVTFSGTTEAGSTVTVTVDGADHAATVNGTGWTVTVTLPDGDQAATVVAADPAGNGSSPGTVFFALDTSSPDAPVLDAVPSPTNAASLTISGTAEPGATVTILVDGIPVATTAAADGAFSAEVTVAEGDHEIAAVASDPAGNASSGSAGASVVVDLTAPLAPTITSPAEGASVPAGTVAFQGTAEPGSTVEVAVNGGTYEVTAAPDGAFSIDVSLPAGSWVATVTVTDPAGNGSPGTSISFTAAAPSSGGGGGCGCDPSGGASSSALLFLPLALALLPRRRRGRSGPGRAVTDSPPAS